MWRICGLFRFNGEEYPTRLIALDMPEISGQQLISVDSLDVALMTKDGCYVSEEARAIDEEVSLYEGNSLPLLASLLQLERGVRHGKDSRHKNCKMYNCCAYTLLLLQQRCCPHLFADVQSDHDSA